MLWTVFVILLVLWLLGIVSSYTLGGFIHILLVVAIVVLLITFGSFVAMGLPIITALLGLGVGISLAGLGSHIIQIPDFATELAAMIAALNQTLMHGSLPFSCSDQQADAEGAKMIKL